MTEFELKLEIPPDRLKSVIASMLEGKTLRQRLQARYFDTLDGTLAAHGIVVRLRKEGRRWVQTAKGPTEDLLDRLEHNVTLPLQPAASTPPLDLSRHSGTPVGQAISKALGLKNDKSLPQLVLHHSTDVERITRRITYEQSVVEIALDQGRVFSDRRSQVICELELELMEGTPSQAVALARQWCSAHGLWLSSISKSMKGQRLRSAELLIAAQSALAPKFSRHASGEEMTTAVVQSCLNQILSNASEVASDLASGSELTDHVHQLRVGIRRLRTALRELGGLTGAIDPAWEAVLMDVFRSLGRHRDRSHLALSLQPQLLAAGGPDVHFKDANSIVDLGATVRAAHFQDVLLGLVGFLHREVQGKERKKAVAPGTLKKALSRRLKKLHAHALHHGEKFLILDEDQQHSVRKRLKQLRYLIEFAAPIFASRKVKQMTTALEPAQDVLGLYNDELMALHAWRALAADDSKAWFGVGWFTARRLPNAKRCLKEITAVAGVKPFWRK